MISIRERALFPFAALTLCFLATGFAVLLWGRSELGVRVIGLACAGGAAASWLIGLAITHSIAAPLKAAANTIRSGLAAGEMCQPAEIDRPDEIGDLLKAFAAVQGFLARDTELLSQREEELRTQNTRFETALSNMSHGLAMFDGARRLIVCNPRYGEIYKLPAELLQPGTPQPEILQHRVAAGTFATGDAAKQIQARVDNASNGETRESIVELSDGRILATTHRPMPDGGWVSTHQDITERRRAQAQVEHLARHDALTDLPNRVQFGERIQAELARTRRHGGMFALLSFDLDRFKAVNDTLGHHVGDVLLRMVSERARECVRDTDLVARFGGDEFAVLQVAINRPESAILLASRVVEAISRTYEIENHQVTIGASVGIAIAPDNGTDAEDLLKKADLALYRAKAEGRGTFRFFEPEMDAAAQQRRMLELDLRNALANEEFTLEYQPLVDLGSGKISGFEAQLHWCHPSRGVVPQSEFLRVCEEIGLTVPLGAWVLQQACADARGWPEHVKVAVDVRAAQFKSGALVNHALQALASSGISPSRLELEITESVLLDDSAANLSVLHQLRELGVRISMDDFGTGYSSLNSLRSFPFDKVKIDRAFVSGLSDDAQSMAVLHAMRGLGSSLSLTTTADGVQTEEQLEKLRAEGCREAQGFYFGPARSAREAAKLIDVRNQSVAA